MVPFIKAQGVEVGIASFGEADEEALISGIPLIRKYLDTAFGPEKSKDLIPDDMIALWHPQSKSETDKVVGKNSHIAFLLDACKAKGKKIPKSSVRLMPPPALLSARSVEPPLPTLVCEAAHY